MISVLMQSKMRCYMREKLETLSLTELRKFAKDQNLKGASTMKKALLPSSLKYFMGNV